MNLRILLSTAVLIGAVLANTNDAQARHHHHYRQHSINYGGDVVSHPSGCPRTAFCGCGVSVRVFGHPVRDLYLASNWFRFPHAIAAPGMVAVRNHHVLYIESITGSGNAVVYDPNSGGHQTRVHERSLNGFSIRDPRGRRYASQ